LAQVVSLFIVLIFPTSSAPLTEIAIEQLNNLGYSNFLTDQLANMYEGAGGYFALPSLHVLNTYLI